MFDYVSAMVDEEDRLRRHKRVLHFSQPMDRCYPKGRSTKRKSSSLFPDIQEHWAEVESNPWEGQGTGQYGSNPRFPMVRSYGAGRDSIVATYRLSESYRSQFQEAVGLPLPTTTQAQMPSQLQSPAARSQSTYSSPPSSQPHSLPASSTSTQVLSRTQSTVNPRLL